VTDVAHELLREVLDGGEDAARDHIAFDLGEPQFHLIEPGRVRGREMQMNLRVGLQKLGDP
jgi:hypothetical protein